MKIGVLRRRYLAWGGGERFAHHFLESLAAAGHEVHLFCHAWRAAPPGVRLHRVPSLAGGALGLLLWAVLAPRLARRAGLDIVHGLDRTLGQDVFRAGEGCHREWLALRARGRRGRLGEIGLRPLHRAVLLVERAIARGRAARVLEVNSRMVEQDFRRRYGELGPRVALVRNGVDSRRFGPAARAARRHRARTALGFAEERLVLLAVGSGYERKGIPTLVQALARTSRPRPALLVAGKGDAAALAVLARAEQVDEDVRALGEIDDLGDAYAAADIFVLPTVYDPASNATLEALAMGVPVITTTRNGAAEIVEHERSAWLLDDPGDVDGLRHLIDQARDARLRRRVGEAGRQAVEPWTWQRHVDETLSLYRSLR